MSGPDPGHDAPVPGPGGRLGRRRSRPCSRATSRPTPTAATARRWPSAWTPEIGVRGADGPVDRRLQGRRRLDAPDRHFARATSARTRSSGPGCRSRSARRVAFQMQGKPNVALTFFGDGATNIGTFHEALNMAAVWKAPVVFIITNNLYGEYSPLRDDDRRSTTWPGAPIRSGCPASSSTARTSTSVHAATVGGGRAGARRRGPEPARDEDLPLPRALAHRPGEVPARGELERWKARDPIDILGARLADERHLSTPTTQAEIRDEIQAEIDAAAERAASRPVPDPRGDAAVCLR